MKARLFPASGCFWFFSAAASHNPFSSFWVTEGKDSGDNGSCGSVLIL